MKLEYPIYVFYEKTSQGRFALFGVEVSEEIQVIVMAQERETADRLVSFFQNKPRPKIKSDTISSPLTCCPMSKKALGACLDTMIKTMPEATHIRFLEGSIPWKETDIPVEEFRSFLKHKWEK